MQLLVFGLAAVVLLMYGRLLTMEKRVSRLPIQEDEITEKDIYELISQGEEVKAVKIAREQYGLSLIEGKKYIDQKKNAE